jgi:hypothetical protein
VGSAEAAARIEGAIGRTNTSDQLSGTMAVELRKMLAEAKQATPREHLHETVQFPGDCAQHHFQQKEPIMGEAGARLRPALMPARAPEGFAARLTNAKKGKGFRKQCGFRHPGRHR